MLTPDRMDVGAWASMVFGVTGLDPAEYLEARGDAVVASPELAVRLGPMPAEIVRVSAKAIEVRLTAPLETGRHDLTVVTERREYSVVDALLVTAETGLDAGADAGVSALDASVDSGVDAGADAMTPGSTYESTMDHDVADWTIPPGRFRFDADRILARAPCGGDNFALLTASGPWENAIATAQVWLNPICRMDRVSARIGLRAQPGDLTMSCTDMRMHYCSLDSDGALSAGTIDGTCTAPPRLSNAVAVARDTWYTLTLRVSGSDVQCAVSGGGLTPSSVSWVVASPLPAGTLALGVHGELVAFDDVTVSPLP